MCIMYWIFNLLCKINFTSLRAHKFSSLHLHSGECKNGETCFECLKMFKNALKCLQIFKNVLKFLKLF